jgi:hypothetical protein
MQAFILCPFVPCLIIFLIISVFVSFYKGELVDFSGIRERGRRGKSLENTGCICYDDT